MLDMATTHTDVHDETHPDERPAVSAFGTHHEHVVHCQDEETGLKAIIAIYSTALGPALGGTRIYPYAHEDDALADVLNLSQGMAYKAALAGLDFGGGKAVIIGDPDSIKSEALLRAYGRFVQSLGGRYITACDVGTDAGDMDVIAHECDYVVSRTVEHGGSGDPSPMTAYGVFQGMRAAAQHVWGEPSLAGRTVGVEGVGKVGSHLVDYLRADGAEVFISDIHAAASSAVTDRHPEVRALDHDKLLAQRLDIYAPCALGGALNDETVDLISARIICGSANNQLAHDGIEKRLAERDIVYAPDYLVNAGGLIQVSDELDGFNHERARSRVTHIFDATGEVLSHARHAGIPPSIAADRIAEQRIRQLSRLHPSWMGPTWMAGR